MAVTGADVLERVHAGASDSDLAEDCASQCMAYVDKWITDNDPDGLIRLTIPVNIIDLAYLVCAEHLFAQAKAEAGVAMTAYQPGDDGAGVQVRIARDPMVEARVVLKPWITDAWAL